MMPIIFCPQWACLAVSYLPAMRRLLPTPVYKILAFLREKLLAVPNGSEKVKPIVRVSLARRIEIS